MAARSGGRSRPNPKEETYDLDQFLEKAESANQPWPQLSVDAVTLTQVSRVERRSGPREDFVKVGIWTMVGVVGSVTIYAIATGNDHLLLALLGMAALLLTRLTWKGAENVRSKEDERNHYSDDS
jgi:hypothetical protein